MRLGGVYAAVFAVTASLLLGIMFRKPASTIRSGDELSALSWLLAVHRGQGEWHFYPLCFNISFEDGRTVSLIDGSGTTTSPGLRPVEDIPVPESYTVTDAGIEIVFHRIP